MPQPGSRLGDSVDRVVAEWAVEAPRLPVWPIEVVTRVGRLRALFDEELAGRFAQYDLTAADFTVIAALRRAGAPYRLPQSALLSRLGLTSGTVSVRLTRLEGKGVVTRTPSPDDARGARVQLTDLGVDLFEQVAPAHLHNEAVLVSALTAAEVEQLADLLRKLLLGFEQERSASPLGMVVAPAHLARRMRVAVGLSDTAGLLVTDVLADTPAQVARLQPGDLLVALDGQDLRSCLLLAQHTDRAAANGEDVTVDFLRGSRRKRVTLRPNPTAPVQT